jgi:hypothetical protein
VGRRKHVTVTEMDAVEVANRDDGLVEAGVNLI